jgi:hypothetical protein
MKPNVPCLALLLSAALALPAQAQSIKAGLWEITNKAQSGDGKLEQAMANLEQQMAALGPEQRKMMEEMMAKQGVSLGKGTGGVSVKMCMTKEMAAQSELPMQTQGDCTTTRKKTSATTMALSFVCTNPPSRGEGVATFISDTAYTMAMKVSANMAGKDETMSLNARGNWLSADCGAIKPLVAPKAK